jgi:hypothetical protein
MRSAEAFYFDNTEVKSRARGSTLWPEGSLSQGRETLTLGQFCKLSWFLLPVGWVLETPMNQILLNKKIAISDISLGQHSLAFKFTRGSLTPLVKYCNFLDRNTLTSRVSQGSRKE